MFKVVLLVVSVSVQSWTFTFHILLRDLSVKSCLQDAAANAGVVSVYPTTILYYHHQLFFDIE